MVALRSLRQRFAVHFGFVLALYLSMPSQIAQQDLAGLLTFQPSPIERGHGFLLSFSALRAATFAMPRPAIFALPELPEALRVAARSQPDASAGSDITGSIPGAPSISGIDNEYEEPQTTVVNRANKGDRMAINIASVSARSVAPDAADVSAATNTSVDIAATLNSLPSMAEVEQEPRADRAGTIAQMVNPISPVSEGMYRVAGLFFSDDPAALPASNFQHNEIVLASLGTAPTEGSTTLAAKGEVTGEEAQPKSPADRLGLSGARLAKAEKCLADAIYFESRGEIKKGQIAVAQVVINRAFSGFYPNDICGVVYQNANRYLACQFTFACEGKKLVVEEPDMWKQATEISHDMLAGKLWLDEIGKATHYHAYWVHPDWIREMRKIDRIGVHTFYRPRAWEG